MYSDGVVRVNIAPWTCGSELPLTAMVDRGCSKTLEVTWESDFGVIGSDNVLRELWLGEDAVVTVTATDDCGQITKYTFVVRPINNILPVPLAEDEVNVSLTGDPTGTVSSDGGIAKVFVNAIDAGSHNNGCGPVDACLLMKEELENPIFIDGEHISLVINSQVVKLYHPSGCRSDGNTSWSASY